MNAKTLGLASFLVAGAATSALAASADVSKKTLPNGMTVLVKEMHSSPVVAVNAWIKVGSVHENDKEKGISHFIEHMLFKGTDKLETGELDRIIKAAGGYNNAHTRYESTDFIDVLPADKVDVAIETTADVLQNSTFPAEEFDRERKVVLEELSRGQDNPSWEAWNRLTHLVFEKHPYRHPIIGYQDVLKSMSRKDLVSYWKKWYRPENIIFVVVGDVNAAATHRKIAKAFKGWTVKMKKPAGFPKEPVQNKMRYEEFAGDIQTTMAVLGVPAPAELDTDAPAMEMAVAILGQGLSSRLNQSVRERQKLVQSVSAGQFNGKSPGLVYLFADLDHAKVKPAVQAMWAEVERMKNEPVTERELSRQRVRLEHEEANERMSMEGMAGKLGYYEALGGDYRLSDTFTERMREVSARDIQRVMQRYFKPELASLVVYRSEKSQALGLNAAAWQKNLASVAAAKAPSSVAEKSFKRFKLANGLTVLIKPIRHTPLVNLHMSFKAGQRFEPRGKEGAFNLLARLAHKGTAGMNAEQIAKALDDLGAQGNPLADADRYGFSGEVLAGHFEEGLDLFAEIIKHPSVPQEEFDKEKARVLKDIRDKTDDPDDYAMDLFAETFFKKSPYKNPLDGSLASVKKLKREDLLDLHTRYVVPNNGLLVLVGDLDPAAARAMVERRFGPVAWPAKALKLPAVPAEKPAGSARSAVKRLKKKQAHLVAGWPAPAPTSPDYFAARLLNGILGEGMDSRLFTEVRDKRGLCYVVHSWFDRRLDAGAWKVYVGTQPEKLEEARKTVLDVVQKVVDEGVTEEEFKNAKAYAKGIFKVARQDFGAEARMFSSYEFLGLGAAKIDAYPDLIDRVKIGDLKRVAKKYLGSHPPVIAVVKP